MDLFVSNSDPDFGVVTPAGMGSAAESAITKAISRVLRAGDVEINGPHAWDPQVKNASVYRAAMRMDLCELGEAYVRGDWDCDRVDQLIEHLSRTHAEPKPTRMRLLGEWIASRIRDGGSKLGARKVAREHYDLGNDLFEAMLDPTMTYSCGYWREAQSLAAAQEAKLDLVCRKLRLQRGMKIADIGGGWGSLAIHAATRYGVEVVMITVSEEQREEAAARCAGLPIEVRKQDYRDLEGSFDAVASVGMFEHVGARHYREFMNKARSLLNPGALFLLHAIGSNDAPGAVNPWIERSIFPGSHIPTTTEIGRAIEGLFVTEDWHNFGADYDRTLMAWYENFQRAWPTLQQRYSADFYRRWRLYLLGCAGAFRSRHLQLWQLVLSAGGVPGGYQRVN